MRALPDTLSLRHALVAIAVMAVWGTNFVVIRVGLDHLPPLLFATLRFAFALFPAVVFLKRPAVRWRNLAAYGVLIGGGLLYIGMNGHITPGLASLVVQAQVFFTIALAAYLNAERVRPFHIVALIVTVAGLAVIAMHTDGSTTTLGLALVLAAALSWAVGNLVAPSAPYIDMLAYVVWASLFSVPPLLAASLAFEGAGRQFAKALFTPAPLRGARSYISRWAIRFLGMRLGAGCWRATLLPRLPRCRCWCRCSGLPPQRYGSVSLCKRGSWKRWRWLWPDYVSISYGPS